MVIRSLGRISALLSSALFAEAVRVDQPEQRRSRRSLRRIVKRAEHSSLADWFPATRASERGPALAPMGC